MSTTDNAFIKVYHRGPIENSEQGSWQQIDPPHSAGFVTTTDTNTPATGQSQAAVGNSRTAQPPHLRTASPSRPAGTERNPQPSARQPLRAHDWMDHAHTAPQAPHVRVERFANGPSVRTLPPTHVPEPSSRFSPSWEVDRFNWPAICSDAQDCWISPLNTVVRSVIRQAWQGGNVVAVTQAVRGEGATTLSLCLSRIAAAFQIPVALVDGHRHCSGVAKALRLHVEQGWDETSPTSPLEEAAIRSLEDGLVVLPVRAQDHTQDWEVPADLRTQLLQQLSSSFELVVVDVGPMYIAAHDWFSVELTKRVGCALVVRDVRTTESAQTDDVCHRLCSAGVQNVSIIENFQIA